MDQYTFDSFLKKVATQTHSPEELAEFISWLQTLPEGQAAMALNRYEQAFHADEEINDEALRRIEEGIENRLGPIPVVRSISYKRTSLVFYLRVAAVFVVVASLVSFFLYTNRGTKNTQGADHTVATIIPGKNQAVLQLSSGQSIVLDSLADGVITMHDQATHFQKSGGSLVAKAAGHSPNAANEINMLETPRGGQYQLALPDGTRVWLNASTRLFFPTVFKPGERRVKVVGEAYFEVYHDPANPFIVETAAGTSLRVLGTSFNVNAYPDDTEETTTLVTGSLQVTRTQSQALLKPGQQAAVPVAGKIAVKEVETSYAVAWKEGYFMFNREPIKEVMNKIARWYDVEVTYEGPAADTKFWGTVSRFSQVGEVLKMLEATGRVHFSITGRRIHVTQ